MPMIPPAPAGTPVDTTAAHVTAVPSGGTASGGGTANPGAAAAVDHLHPGPLAPAPPPTGSQNIAKVTGGWSASLPTNYSPQNFSNGVGVFSVGPYIIAPSVRSGAGTYQSFVLVYDTNADLWYTQAIAGWTTGTGGAAVNWASVTDATDESGQTGTIAVTNTDVDSQGRIWALNTNGNMGATPTTKKFGFLDTNVWTWTDCSATVPAGIGSNPNQYLMNCGILNDVFYAYFADGTFWSYDTRQGTKGVWVQKASTNGGTQRAGGAIRGANRYLVAAAGNSYLYNPVTNTWATVPAVPYSASPETFGSCGPWAVCGYYSGAGSTFYVYGFNTRTNTWGSQIVVTGPPNVPQGAMATVGNSLVYWANDTAGGTPAGWLIDPAAGTVTSSSRLVIDPSVPVTIGGGKLSASGTAPTIAAGAGLGTTPPTPTAAGNSTRGVANMGTGTTPAAGAAATVTFAAAYAVPPVVTLTPLNAATAALQPYVSATTAGSFTIAFVNAPAASQAAGTYSLAFQVIG